MFSTHQRLSRLDICMSQEDKFLKKLCCCVGEKESGNECLVLSTELISNISNTRKSVSSDFQTPRSRLEK